MEKLKQAIKWIGTDGLLHFLAAEFRDEKYYDMDDAIKRALELARLLKWVIPPYTMATCGKHDKLMWHKKYFHQVLIPHLCTK